MRIFRPAARVGLALALCQSALCLWATNSSWATQTLLKSGSPYWTAGERDKKLSQLCSVGRFNQRDVGHYVVRLHGTKGFGVLGVAKGNGFNLYDPGHHAIPTEDYLFAGDGTSACSVFVGGRSAPPAAGTPGGGSAGSAPGASAAAAPPAPASLPGK